MEAVLQAVKEARYNEAVVVNLQFEEQQTERELMLTAVLDEENGGVVWRDVSQSLPDHADDEIRIVRHLRTKRWVLAMLNDTLRNHLYNDAIRDACAEAIRRRRVGHDISVEPIHIVDIGTGSGLLAMLACQHAIAALGVEQSVDHLDQPVVEVKVTSIEMASAMVSLSRKVIAANCLQDQVRVVEGHSSEVSLSDRAVVCTSELLDSSLLGEGILPALRDAWERHLHPDAIMVPQHARVYAQLIESPSFAGGYHGLHPRSEIDSASIPLRLSLSLDENDVSLGQCVSRYGHGVLVPVHAEKLLGPSVRTNSISTESDLAPGGKALCAPVLTMEFDFSSKEAFPPRAGRSVTVSCTAESEGIVHGVLFYWELDLCDGSTYSTQPGKGWQDHWQQCMYLFPYRQQSCVLVKKGELVHLKCSHTDYKLDFAIVQPRSNDLEPPATKRPWSTCTSSSLKGDSWITSHRALQLNGSVRIDLLRRGIAAALGATGCHAPVLDLADFSLCGILAALEGATIVTSVESSTGNVPELSARVAQIANGLPLPAKEEVTPKFQILQCHAESLSLGVMFDRAASVVVAEPYYEILEGWHLQEALNYYYLVKALRKRHLVEDLAVSVPSYAAVMVCGVQCAQLFKAYGKVGDDVNEICGLNHSSVNKYGNRYHKQDLCISMWEYNYTALTKSIELARIWFDGTCGIDGNGVCQEVAFDIEGTCHGIICWLEYGVRVGSFDGPGTFDRLSTFTRSHRQVFRMLPSPATVTVEEIGRHWLNCGVTLGALDGLEDHGFELSIDYRQVGNVPEHKSS